LESPCKLSWPLGFNSSRGNPDVWFGTAQKSEVKNIMITCLYIQIISWRLVLTQRIKFKSLNQTPFTHYLGTKIKKTVLSNGAWAWGQSSSHYVRNAVKNLEELRVKEGRNFPKQAPTPMSSTYKQEVDVSPELSPDMSNFYRSQVGVLRWIIEMGRLNITTKMSMLAEHMAVPREGHLIHVFAYLKYEHNASLIYDPSYPRIKTNDFKINEDWKAFYGKVKEAIPLNAPPPRGCSVMIQIYVDANHARNMVTRRSRSGYVQFVKNAVVDWFSKKQ
jgi:hypothetical protein